MAGESLVGAVDDQGGGDFAAAAGEVPGAQAQLIEAVVELLRIERRQRQCLCDAARCRFGFGQRLPAIAADCGELQPPAHELCFGELRGQGGACQHFLRLGIGAGAGERAAPRELRRGGIGRVFDAQ
ncbi:MAG: hypothetical protein CRU78_18910, partial [Candidatus Accumulibacter phosphatis]|nr:hypothetical protein [Candidatus Accumulibacter phosphatis]